MYLAASYRQGAWILAADGSGMPTDFVNVWAAGKLVLQGTPALAYDWTPQKAVQVAALGHPFDGYFGWHYRPTFLFLAMALAMLPYVAAFVLWAFGTFVIYLFVAGKIVGERSGFFLPAGFPAVLANFIAGQNGFFNAALLGGALFMLAADRLRRGPHAGRLGGAGLERARPPRADGCCRGCGFMAQPRRI